jgi:hypothetical protein
MSWTGITLTVLAAVMLAAIAAVNLFSQSVKREVLNDPEYQKQMAHLHASHLAEETVMEQAPWIGTTGLDETTERELPKYLRREFGELLLDEGSLKAADLTYIGSFPEAHGSTHFWGIPSSESELYAYVEDNADGPGLMGWGNRAPPDSAAAAPSSTSADP